MAAALRYKGELRTRYVAASARVLPSACGRWSRKATRSLTRVQTLGENRLESTTSTSGRRWSLRCSWRRATTGSFVNTTSWRRGAALESDMLRPHGNQRQAGRERRGNSRRLAGHARTVRAPLTGLKRRHAAGTQMSPDMTRDREMSGGAVEPGQRASRSRRRISSFQPCTTFRRGGPPVSAGNTMMNR